MVVQFMSEQNSEITNNNMIEVLRQSGVYVSTPS